MNGRATARVTRPRISTRRNATPRAITAALLHRSSARCINEGMFCSTCTNGTRKLSGGQCCDPTIGESVSIGAITPFVLPVLLSAWIFRKCVVVKASDTIISTFTFMLQVLKLVGVEKGWGGGLPYVNEAVDSATGIAGMDSPPVPSNGPCDAVPCGSWGGDGGVIGSFYLTALINPLLMCLAMGLVVWMYRQEAVVRVVQKITFGKVFFQDSSEAREAQSEDWKSLYHRGLLSVYEFCFMPATFAALEILLPRQYNDFEHPYNATVDESLWLLNADPSIKYFRQWDHIIAGIVAEIVLLLQLVVIPMYLFMGARIETGNPGCCAGMPGAKGMQTSYEQLYQEKARVENLPGNYVKRWKKSVKYKKLEFKKDDLRQVQLREQSDHMAQLKELRTVAIAEGDKRKAAELKREILDVLYGTKTDLVTSEEQDILASAD